PPLGRLADASRMAPQRRIPRRARRAADHVDRQDPGAPPPRGGPARSGPSAEMSAPAPTVSVLMPVHDAGEFLRPTVESVLAQTMVDFEIVLIDDGSTDGRVDEIAALRE